MKITHTLCTITKEYAYNSNMVMYLLIIIIYIPVFCIINYYNSYDILICVYDNN